MTQLIAPILLVIVLLGGGLFWLGQIIRVMVIDSRYFESHTHRLLWFLVVLLSFIVGAMWFFIWYQRRLVTEREQLTHRHLTSVANALTAYEADSRTA